MSEYLDQLEAELRAASSRRVLLETARVPRPRASALAVSAAIATCAIVVAFALAIGSATTRQAPTAVRSSPPRLSRDYQATQALLAGIPQSGAVLGRPTAPVTVTFFGDLQSPISRAFTLGQDGAGFPRLVNDQVRSGAVKIIFRSLCTSTCAGHGANVFDTQQIAAYAAGKQALFWDYAELFYREQGKEGTGYVTAKYLDRLANQIPALDMPRWQRTRTTVVCRHSPASLHRNPICTIAPTLLAQIRTDARTARQDHVISTPTIIVTGPKGAAKRFVGPPSYTMLHHAITQVDRPTP